VNADPAISKRRLAIIGLTGRMGTEIRSLAREAGFVVTTGVAHRNEKEVDGIPVVASPSQLRPSDVDVVIDFSLPEVTPEVVRWCESAGKPLVCGVTGIDERVKAQFQNASKKIPVLWAPNMSLGVAVVGRMLAALSALDDYEFQIEELHHKRKKDKPSGTALFLQEKLKAAVKVEVPDPLAIRGGGIFGIHRIWAMGEEETITIEHTAMNRRVFARGALRAATWIRDRAPGLYRMDDVL
jgi:4-hydroxy-tetrahydrodipicolinate reductase